MTRCQVLRHCCATRNTTPTGTANMTLHNPDPRNLAPNTVGAIDDETGRVCVRVAAYAACDSMIDAPAYWYSADADAFGMDPWRLVYGVDPHVGGLAYDVWFADNITCRTVGIDATFYVSQRDADRMAAEIEAQS